MKRFLLFLSITLLFVSCDDDVAVESELEKAPKLTFTKLTINKKNISKEELLKQIKEKEKEGFTIKNITISDTSFADIDKTNFSLTLKKAGTFTIKLTLQKTGFENVIIEATIEYLLNESLNFKKFTTSKSIITKENILNSVTGKKDNFTIKSIVLDDQYKSFADVVGTAPDLSLNLKKAGDFTATIILQKNNYTNVTLTALFSAVPQKLTFNKLITFKKTITKTELLGQIPEIEKDGFILKSILVKDNSFADVKGTTPNFSLNLKKLGNFKADITLSKTDFLDVVIKDAAFNHISEKLAFPKLKTFKKTLTKNDILKHLQGKKDGYTIKKIKVTVIRFANVDPTTNSLTLKRDGLFTIILSLEKAGYPKEIIGGTIEYRPKPILTFDTLTTANVTISKAEIEAKIKGNKSGYAIINIKVNQPGFATADNNNFSINLKNPGRFTATITLGKVNYFDVTLHATFEGVFRSPAFSSFLSAPTTPNSRTTRNARIHFPKLITYKDLITKEDILNNVSGPKTGYTIKSISNITPSNVAELTGANKLSLHIKKTTGSFTAKIVLKKPSHSDVILTGASFEKEKAFIFDKNTKTITGVTPKYKTYFATATEVTFPDQIDGTNVEVIKGNSNFSLNVFGSNSNGTIKTIHLPKNLKTIGNYAFYNCSSLTSITIPNSVTSIGSGTFEGSYNLIVTIKQTVSSKITKISSNTFNNVKQIKVPSSSLQAYKTDYLWKKWGNKIVGY